jgi:Flp pilus assembly protein TadB
MRRLGLIVAATAAIVATAASPASADRDLALSVGKVTLDQVQLVVAIPGASPGQLPSFTVSRDGYALPSTVEQTEASTLTHIDARSVIAVVDTSEAMGEDALTAAREGLLAFADVAPADVSIGLVAAADEPAVLVQPTRDRVALRAGLEKLQVAGNTAIYEGLRTAVNLAVESLDRQVLVVAGSPDTANAVDVALDRSSAGQRIDLIAVGDARDGLDQLRRLVTESGGKTRAASSATLPGVLRAAASYAPLVSITVAVPPDLAGTTGTLMVTAGSGSDRATGRVNVRFASPPSQAPAAVAAGPHVLGFSLSSPRVVAVLLFGTLLLAFLLFAWGMVSTLRETRLKQVEQFRLAARGGGTGGGQTVLQAAEGGFARLLHALSDRVSTVGGTEEQVATKLDRAGMTLRPGQWKAWRFGATFTGVVVLGLLGGLIGALLGAVLGWFAAGLYRRVREQRRKQAFADQLPDSLQMIASSLRSGFSLAQAIDAVVQESSPGPLTVELGRAMGEVRLGADLNEAMERAAERVESEDLAWAVMAMRIQRETGGNLAEILETTVETLRERERLRRHVRALSAEGRLSGYILIAMPFATFAWFLLIRRDYLSALWTTPFGLAMLLGAAVLMAIGAVWMARWVKVEV